MSRILSISSPARALSLAALCLSLAVAAVAAQDVGGKVKGAKSQGELAGQLKRANTELRAQISGMIQDAARSHSLQIREEAMMISSVSPTLMVAGAPVQGIHDLMKGGAGKGLDDGQGLKNLRGERRQTNSAGTAGAIQEPAGQEPAPQGAGAQAGRDKAAKAGHILGLILVSGGENKAVEAGAGAGIGRKAPGGIQAGAYAIRGEASADTRQIELVGEDGRVYATVKIDPAYAPRKGREEWWDAVYLSILAQLVPLAS